MSAFVLEQGILSDSSEVRCTMSLAYKKTSNLPDIWKTLLKSHSIRIKGIDPRLTPGPEVRAYAPGYSIHFPLLDSNIQKNTFVCFSSYVVNKTPFREFYFYRFDHCGAFRAFFNPNLRRSLARGSRLSIPAFFKGPRT